MPRYFVVGELCETYSGHIDADSQAEAEKVAWKLTEEVGDEDALFSIGFQPGDDTEYHVGSVTRAGGANPRRAYSPDEVAAVWDKMMTPRDRQWYISRAGLTGAPGRRLANLKWDAIPESAQSRLGPLVQADVPGLEGEAGERAPGENPPGPVKGKWTIEDRYYEGAERWDHYGTAGEARASLADRAVGEAQACMDALHDNVTLYGPDAEEKEFHVEFRPPKVETRGEEEANPRVREGPWRGRFAGGEWRNFISEDDVLAWLKDEGSDASGELVAETLSTTAGHFEVRDLQGRHRRVNFDWSIDPSLDDPVGVNPRRASSDECGKIRQALIDKIEEAGEFHEGDFEAWQLGEITIDDLPNDARILASDYLDCLDRAEGRTGDNPRARAAVATDRPRAEALAMMESQVEMLWKMVAERGTVGAAGYLWGLIGLSRRLGLIRGDTATMLENVAEALHDQALDGRWSDFRDTLDSAETYLGMLSREER